jgi:hypothetical protein
MTIIVVALIIFVAIFVISALAEPPRNTRRAMDRAVTGANTPVGCR